MFKAEYVSSSISANIFGDGKLWKDIMKYVKDYAKEVYQVTTKSTSGKGTNIEERLISWLPPMIGWTKLNTNRALHGNSG